MATRKTPPTRRRHASRAPTGGKTRAKTPAKTRGKTDGSAAGPSVVAGAPPPRIARIAKGRKPQYFSDPAIDKLLWMTLTLMEELSVTRDRLDTVERLLDAAQLLALRDIEGYQPGAGAAAERAARRAAYVDRVMRAAQAELEELTARGMPRSEAEVVAAVEA